MKTPFSLLVQLDGAAIRVHLYQRPRSPFYWAHASLPGRGVIRFSTQHTILREAQIIAKNKVLERAAQRPPILSTGHLALSTLISQFLQETYPEHHPQTKPAAMTYLTFIDRKSRLKTFREWAGDLDFTTIDFDKAAEHIQLYLNSRRGAGCAPTSIDNERRGVQPFMRWLITSRRVIFRSNPCDKGPHLSLPEPSTKVYPDMPRETFMKVLQRARRENWYPALLLMVGNGMRSIGTSRLLWSDFDEERKAIWTGEKDQQRFPRAVNDYIVEELIRIRKARRARPTDRIALATRNHISREFTKLIKKVLGDSTPYRLKNLRNTFLVQMFEANAAPQKVAALAGNSVSTIEQKYLEIARLKAHKEANMIDLRPAKPKRKNTA